MPVSLPCTPLRKSRTKGNVSHQSNPEWSPCHSVGTHQSRFKPGKLKIEKNQNSFFYYYFSI